MSKEPATNDETCKKSVPLYYVDAKLVIQAELLSQWSYVSQRLTLNSAVILQSVNWVTTYRLPGKYNYTEPESLYCQAVGPSGQEGGLENDILKVFLVIQIRDEGSFEIKKTLGKDLIIFMTVFEKLHS